MSKPVTPLEAELVLGFLEQIDRQLDHVFAQCADDPELRPFVRRMQIDAGTLKRLATDRSQPGYPDHVDVRPTQERTPCVKDSRRPETLGERPAVRDPEHLSDVLEGMGFKRVG